MQAALVFVPASLPFVAPAKKLVSSPLRPLSTSQISLIRPIKATLDAVPNETSEVDYNSMATSVFPAEACETVGGEACDAEIYPDLKLKAEVNKNTPKESTAEKVEREYQDYNSPKTVFPGEACDDLGGEFCEPEYQKGVY